MKLKLEVLEINIGEDTANFHLVPHKYIFEAKWPRKWPKWPSTDFQISKKSVFRLFQPPAAKNDPDTENTNQPDFDKNCLVYSVSGSFLGFSPPRGR